MAKFKSKLREKMKARSKRDEAGGRGLGYGGRTAEKHYSKRTTVTPEKSGTGFSSAIKSRVLSAVASQTKKALASNTKPSKKKGGLLGITHPSQLIPAIQKGRTISGIINALRKK